jgi:hypothetical protein
VQLVLQPKDGYVLKNTIYNVTNRRDTDASTGSVFVYARHVNLPTDELDCDCGTIVHDLAVFGPNIFDLASTKHSDSLKGCVQG